MIQKSETLFWPKKKTLGESHKKAIFATKTEPFYDKKKPFFVTKKSLFCDPPKRLFFLLFSQLLNSYPADLLIGHRHLEGY